MKNQTPKPYNPFVGCYIINGKTHMVEATLTVPLKRKKPTTFLVCSISDLFHDSHSFEDIDKVFAVMESCPQHTFQVLTKQAKRALEYLTAYQRDISILLAWHSLDQKQEMPDISNGWPLKNVWLGTSVENQQAANERVPILLQCPAAVRFLSCEPLLGAVDLTKIPSIRQDLDDRMPTPVTKTIINCLSGHELKWEWVIHDSPDNWFQAKYRYPKIDWVIVSGESGKHARPMHPDWVRSLRDQCAESNTPFRFDGWGDYVPTFFQDVDTGIINRGAYFYLNSVEAVKHFFKYRHPSSIVLVDNLGLVSAKADLDNVKVPAHVMENSPKSAYASLIDGKIHDGFPNI